MEDLSVREAFAILKWGSSFQSYLFGKTEIKELPASLPWHVIPADRSEKVRNENAADLRI